MAIVPPKVLEQAGKYGKTSPWASLPGSRLDEMFRTGVPSERAFNQARTSISGGFGLGPTGTLPSTNPYDNAAELIDTWLGLSGADWNSLSEREKQSLFDTAWKYQEARRADKGPLGFLTEAEFAIPAIVGGGLALGLSGAGAGAGGAGQAANGNFLATAPTTAATAQTGGVTQAFATPAFSGGLGGGAAGGLSAIDLNSIPGSRQLPSGISPDRLSQIEQIASGSNPSLFSPARTAATTGGRKTLEEIDTSTLPTRRTTGDDMGLFGLSPSQLTGIATAGSSLLGGLFGDDSDSITSTQRTELPPEFSRGLNFLLDESLALARQDGQITPDLSDPTLQGLNLLQQGFNPLAVDELTQLAMGGGTSRIEDAITQAAQRAVGDRFSQAGRTGSPGEALSLGSTVARDLAPFAFNAQQSALNQLLNLDQLRAGNFLQAGNIIESQQEAQNLDPFRRLDLLTGPIASAISGAPRSTFSTQPVNRNRAAGALGGILLGSQIGSEFGNFGGPIGAGLGGLLGGFL